MKITIFQCKNRFFSKIDISTVGRFFVLLLQAHVDNETAMRKMGSLPGRRENHPVSGSDCRTGHEQGHDRRENAEHFVGEENGDCGTRQHFFGRANRVQSNVRQSVDQGACGARNRDSQREISENFIGA